MHREIPSVARCCFCAPLRYGLLVWAYLKLATGIAVFGITVLWIIIEIFYVHYKTLMLVSIIVTMLCLGVDIVFNFILIVGCHKKNTSLLQLYYRYWFAHAVIYLSLGVLWIALGIAASRKSYSDPSSIRYIAAMAAAIITPLILHVYLFIVLRSEIKKLQAKDQFRFANPTSECSVQAEDEVNINKKNIDL